MNNIGKRIKEYRKKKNITQEKLAEYLNVSFQAISKWETGVALPDLSMIVPLSRLFNVSTDELLGKVNLETEERQDELYKMYQETLQTGDIVKRYAVCKSLVEEYPGNFEYLLWLADAESSYARHNCNTNRLNKELIEKAVKHYEMIIDDCTDNEIRNYALHGIVLALNDLNRKQEATLYARKHPESAELLLWCLEGEEYEKQRQLLVEIYMDKLIGHLQFGHNNLPSLNAAIKVIEAIIDDGNYLYHHDALMHIYMWKAMCLIKENKYEETIESLKKSYYHAQQYINFEKELDKNDLFFTGSVINKVKYSKGDISHTGKTTLIEDFKEYLSNKVFDAIRCKKEFNELFQ